MPVALKHRPANDLHPRASQQMSCVALPRPYWNMRRVMAAILAGFAAVAGAVVLSFATQTTPSAPVPPVIMVTAQPQTPVKPYDITLPVSAPVPQIDVPVVEEKTPQDVVPQIVDVDVEDGALAQAAERAMPIPSAAKADDDEQSLRMQYRAAQLDPTNMMVRLQLAVLYDRAGKNAGAAQLYRQVLQAYDQQEANLPPSVNIDSIRRRAAYLTAVKE